MHDLINLDRRLARLKAAELLHGLTPAIGREKADVLARLEEMEFIAADEWMAAREDELLRLDRERRGGGRSIERLFSGIPENRN